MSSKKRNRDKIKSGSVSPKENKRLNMAEKTPDLVDITDLNIGSIGEAKVLYDALMKICDGVNEIHKETKSIRRSVDKLNSKVDDITKRLVNLEGSVKNHDQAINELKQKQHCRQ